MTSAPPINPIPLERLLHDLAASIRETSAEESWATVESTARELANHLRVRNASGMPPSLSVIKDATIICLIFRSGYSYDPRKDRAPTNVEVSPGIRIVWIEYTR
jgi:hypothetical protein